MNNLDFENGLKRQASASELIDHAAKKQKIPPASLSTLSGNDRGLELIHFIQILFTLNEKKAPEELPKTVKALAKEVKRHKDITPSSKTEHLARLVKNLISKQFSNPVVESLREIITNALDAQVRANSADQPLLITLEGDTLIIPDFGDGIGTGKLHSLLVPGLSSNGSALFDSETSIEGNTGRFGQGALSVFHLMLPSDKLYISKLAANSLVIEGEFQAEEGPLKVSTVMTSTSPQERQFEFQATQTGRKPKITITSFNGDPQSDPISVKVGLEKTGIVVDVLNSSFPRSRGTCFKIRSSKLNEKSVREALSYFQFTSKTPICFNGELVNPAPGTTKSNGEQINPTAGDFKIVSVEGCRLLLKSESSIDNEYGEIVIAEKGRKILVVPCKGIGISEELILDFNDLQPSQDRATVNWRDPILKSRLEALVKAVIEDSELSMGEKIIVFNFLTGLPQIQGFDLTSLIEDFLKGIKFQLLPNSRLFRDFVSNSSDYFFIDEKHLKKIDAFEQVQWDCCKIYLVPSSSLPAAKGKFQGQVYYLFDKQLFPSPNSSQFILMMQMIQEWINEAHLTKDTKTFDANVFVRKFLADERKKSNVEVLSRIDVTVERSEDFPQAATEKEFRVLANKFLEKFPASIEKKLIQMFLKPSRASRSLIKNQWTPFYESLLRVFIDVHLKASPKITEVISEGTAKGVFLDAYEIVTYELLDDYLDQFENCVEENDPHADEEDHDEGVELFRRRLNEVIELITSHGSGLGPLICLSAFYNRADWDYDRNIVNVVTKFLEKYPVFFDFYSFSENEIEEHSSFELIQNISLFLGYGADKIEELIAFFDRFPQEFANQLMSLLFYENQVGESVCAPSRIDITHLIRSLNAFDNEFVKFFFEIIEPSLALHYRVAVVGIYDQGELHNKLHRLSIPIEVLDDFRNLIYLSKTIPDRLKQEYSNIFFYAYVIQLALTGKTDRVQLNRITQVLSRIKVSDDVYARIHLDFEEVLIDISEKFSNYNIKSLRKNILETLFSSKSKILPISTILLNLISNELGSFASTSFLFPDNLKSQIYPLAEDPDVLAVVGNSTRAKQEIAAALKQNLSGYSFIIKELIRNASDSGCKKILIETTRDADGNFYVTFTDDGSGMDERAFHALKTPNYSTKNKSEQDSSSFGVGFFSVFSTQAFDKVHVCTRDGTGIERKALFIKKNNTEIFYGSEQSSGSQVGSQTTGTRLILKKECQEEAVDIECGIFSIETARIVSELSQVTVYFNGMLISKIGRDELAVSSLSYPGKVDGTKIVVVASDQKSGIYRENLLIAPVAKNYLQLLPRYIKEYLDDKLINFKIFLPTVDQVMTRSHVINSKDVDGAIQHGVLWAAIKTIAYQLVDQTESEFIPHDYWVDFTSHDEAMNPSVKNILICLMNGFYSPVPPELMKQLLSQFDNYLKENKDRLILPPLRPGNSLEDSMTDSYFSPMVEESLQELFQTSIINILNDKQLFTELLTHLPLSGMVTLASIRNEVFSLLKANQILDDDNDYNLKHPLFLPENQDKLPEMLKLLFRGVIEKSEGPLLKKILDHFISNVQERILTNTAPQETLDPQFIAYKPVGKFLQTMSRKILQKEITYKFLHAGGGEFAHTFPGTNCIHINVDIEPFKSLSETMKGIRSGSDLLSTKLEYFKKMAIALSTLAHEVVHMEETKETKFTHDKEFYSKMCSTYERFMMRLAQDESLLIDAIDEAFLEA